MLRSVDSVEKTSITVDTATPEEEADQMCGKEMWRKKCGQHISGTALA